MSTIVYVSLELIRKVSIMLYPIIPVSASKVLRVFNISEDKIDFNSIIDNEFLKSENKINKIGILFKKIDNND